MKDTDVLDMIAWGEEHFGSLVTNREVPRRDVMRCVGKGLAKSIGLALLCDEDGAHLDPERFREGFVLTDDGRRIVEDGRGSPLRKPRNIKIEIVSEEDPTP